MGYSVNPGLVEERKELLKDLAAGQTTKWVTRKDPQSTRHLAYKIREALSIAARYPQQFPELARAAELFSIHEVEDGIVEARFKGDKTATSVAISSPTHGLEPHGKPVP